MQITIKETWNAVQWFPPGDERHNKKETPVHRPGEGCCQGTGYYPSPTPRGSVTVCGQYTDTPYYEFSGKTLQPGDWLLRNGKRQMAMSNKEMETLHEQCNGDGEGI